MRILQLDCDSISYELVKPEASVYEESSEKKATIDDALALLVSVERGDEDSMADRALDDVSKTMAQLKRKRLVIYPFAHLSSDLAEPKNAMKIVDYLAEKAAKSFEVKKAPFGWNKRLTLAIKGHPLAEQSRSYGKEGAKKILKREKPAEVNTSIVRKSDWSGLPDTDHRTIGEKLDLYSFQEVSPGMVYWHNKGFTIYKELVRLLRGKLEEYGYEEICTPVLANVALWHVSGHIEKYKNEMFIFDADSEQLGLRAMGCPNAILVYKARTRSYRELPVRLAEFDMIHRNEVSGALTGLFRARQFTQDDAHIFAREDQIEDEITDIIRLSKEIYAIFEMKYKFYLSTMPEVHLGDEKLWEKATGYLRKALERNKIDYGIKDKDGAFYGPKIDGHVLDASGREWQCITIQLDYQQPQRFNLSYVGENGEAVMPVIIHRTIIGSLERFIGVLVEHYQGKLPAWLSPVQASVIAISEQTNDYAKEVYDELRKRKVRVALDSSDKTLDYKIREAQMQKVPYMLILGKKEQDAKAVTIRSLSGKQEHGVKLEDFAKRITEEILERRSTAQG